MNGCRETRQQILSDEQWERVIHREPAAMLDSVLPGDDLRIVEFTLP